MALPTPLPSRSVGPIPSLVDHCYIQMRDAILKGTWKPNGTLHQEDIAEWLGASRVPVREALKRLEGEGLVVQRPRRGYVVTPLEVDDIEDAFYVRAALEERAGQLAALNRTAEDIEAVEVFVIEGERRKPIRLSEAGDPLFSELNLNFHSCLFQTSGRVYLTRLMAAQRNIVALYINVGRLVNASKDRVEEEHRDIFEAFKRGDAQACGQHCRLHVEHTGRLLLEELRRRREAGA